MRSSPPSSTLPDPLAAAIDAARGRLGPLASRVLFFQTVGSTNDVALGLSDEGCEGALVLADAQTAGRGRRGHEWFSPARAGLYASIVLAPGRASDVHRATQLITLAAGVAVIEGIAAATGLVADLKWPNDVYVGRRKLAGILAEAATRAASPAFVQPVVVGYGINLLRTAYPPELAVRATSLESELDRAVDRDVVLVETLAAVARRYEDLLAGRFDVILDAWRRRSPSSRGCRVSWRDSSGARSGTTAGIDQEGALLVESSRAIERIVAGEIAWSLAE